jgi:hypothetical protein
MIVTLASVADGNGEDGHEVLGSLPRRRPGIESPRRARARAEAARQAVDPPHGESEVSRSELAELERLAGASVKIAGGAALAGLKLAGRAAGGLGRIVGR